MLIKSIKDLKANSKSTTLDSKSILESLPLCVGAGLGGAF